MYFVQDMLRNEEMSMKAKHVDIVAIKINFSKFFFFEIRDQIF